MRDRGHPATLQKPNHDRHPLRAGVHPMYIECAHRARHGPHRPRRAGFGVLARAVRSRRHIGARFAKARTGGLSSGLLERPAHRCTRIAALAYVLRGDACPLAPPK
jgi:hypothetical protein